MAKRRQKLNVTHSVRDERGQSPSIPSTWTINRPDLRPVRMVDMEYEKLIKDIRVELTEAVKADRENEHVRAKACLLHIKTIIDKAIPQEYTG